MKITTQYQRKRIFLGESNNMVVRLICINAVIYLLLSFVKVIYLLSGTPASDFINRTIPWITLPSSLHLFLSRPWTLFTFMFVDISFWHVAGNMLWLWWFGGILQDFAGSEKVVPLYIYGGLAGAVVYVLFYSIFPFSYVWFEAGASASIMAVVFATTLLSPDYRVFPMLRGGIPLWVITILFVVIDMASISRGNAGGYLAHLGGALMGAVFMQQLKKGNDWGGWLNRLFKKFDQLFDPEQRKKEVPDHRRLLYRENIAPYKRIGNIPENKVDELLDKINQHGYDSLTREEKDILMKASRQDD